MLEVLASRRLAEPWVPVRVLIDSRLHGPSDLTGASLGHGVAALGADHLVAIAQASGFAPHRDVTTNLFTGRGFAETRVPGLVAGKSIGHDPCHCRAACRFFQYFDARLVSFSSQDSAFNIF